MPSQKELGIILNPVAGKGRTARISQQLISCLQEKKIPFQLEMTKFSGHATEIAIRMCNEREIVVVAGGDGTINEVLSGIVGSEATLAFLPFGSGNDYNKNIGIPKKIDKAIDAIINGKKKLVDLGKVVYWNKHDEKKQRYFINTLGLGLDAEIAHETQGIRFLRGLPLYLTAAVKALYKHSINEYEITSGKTRRKEQAFFICIGNGNFEGGGFKLLPNAIINDSQLDICVVGAMPLQKAVLLVPKIMKGRHEGLNNISMWKSKEIQIQAKNPFVLHGDGEIFEEHTMRIVADLNERQISILVPPNQRNAL